MHPPRRTRVKINRCDRLRVGYEADRRDIEVEGAFVFDVADELVKRAVPIVFTTGYERSEIPARFHAARHCEKPVGIAAIARTLSDELARHRPSEQQRRMT